MRGSIRKRYKGSWSVIIDLGYQPDSETGELKRKQKWFTVRGTKRDAEKKLADLLHSANRGELAEPTRLTLGAWLDEWLETAIKPPNRRFLTYDTYRGQIQNHLKPNLGSIRLQQLQPTDLQRYYTKAAETLGPAFLLKHHSIIHTALKAAQMQGIVSRNVADLVIGKPRMTVNYQKAMEDCWTADEARASNRDIVTAPQSESG